jgi:dUTP pyrophosphatase
MTTGDADVSVGTGQLDVLITRLDPTVPLPGYARPGDAGADLFAAEDVDLAPGERALVRTGIAIALPQGYAGFVHPVSLRRGDRIAQLVVQRVETVTFREVPALPESARGDNGFGSTGGHAAEYTPRVPAER